MSERWRWLVRATLVGLGMAMVGLAFHRQVAGRTTAADVPVGYRSPVPTGHALDVVAAAGLVVLVLCIVASVVSIVLRYRRSRGEEREQLKWFAAAAVGTVVLLTGGALLPATVPLAFRAVTFVGTQFLPVAAAVAIMKYRLYDIDVVINKTVVFGALAAFATLVYLAVVVGIGAAIGSRGNSALTLAAAAIVAIAFQPLRVRARRFGDRLVYGERATPYEVLSQFSDRISASYSTDDVLPRMVQILGQGTGIERATVWLRVGSEVRLAAEWPDDAPGTAPAPVAVGDLTQLPGAGRTFPVRHQGELLGALGVTMPPTEPLTPSQERLIADLASQAGLILRNVRLIEELRASRQRLVAAQDQERWRIERNIHDGAQQQLVALAVKLRLARGMAHKDADATDAMLAQLQSDAQEALDDLRDLARGIYPPLLADKGLAAALEAQARRSPIPVAVKSDGVGRYLQEVEAAVYFCALEALQNVAKYAGASRAFVRLSLEEGLLRFQVEDDGVGFDLSATRYGTGLQGMADRLEALGGELAVRSAPGSGTTVSGEVRVGHRDG